MQKSEGFTLIELLIVVSIMGIIVTFALLSFGDFGQEAKTKRSGEFFIKYAEAVKQYAMISNKTFSININNTSYCTKVLKDNDWRAITKPPLTQQKLPSNIIFSGNTNEIIINQTGTISAFNFFLGNAKTPKLYKIFSQNNQIVMIGNK